MARLADMIHFWKWYPPMLASSPKALSKSEVERYLSDCEKLKTEITKSQVIVADNVCEYLYAGTDQEVWDFTTDFPSCVPPFETCFVEMKRPSTIRSVDPKIDLNQEVVRQQPQMWGWFCECHSLEGINYSEQTDIRGRIVEQINKLKGMVNPNLLMILTNAADPQKAYNALSIPEQTYIQAMVLLGKIDSGDISLEKVRELIAQSPEVQRGKWLVHGHILIADSGVIRGPMAFIRFVTDENGSIVQKPAMGGHFWTHTESAFAEKLYSTFMSLAMPLALTFSFMNCKNVVVQDNQPRPLSQREIKAKQRPWVTYKTLDINPMRRVLRTEGASEETGLKRAMHICRGHFANYSEEKPLFGRLAGRFWIPSHIRGSIENGTVLKDYRVNPR